MKLLAFFALVAGVGGAVGALYGGGFAASLLPDPGTHGAWYASRASGVASYLFLWVGLVGGLWMSSAWLDGLVNRGRLLAIHQTAGIAGVLLGLGHGLILIPDPWTHFTVKDVLIPYGSYYKPLWSAFGQMTLYMSAIVSFSFWFRSRIGTKTWKYIHYTAFAAYGAGLWHGLMMGTDAKALWLLGLYLSTSLSVVFIIMVRITYKRPVPQRRSVPAARESNAA